MSAQRAGHGLPSSRNVARAQLRLIVGRRPRGVLVALAIVLVQIVAVASAGIIFGIKIQSGHEERTRVMWSRVSDFADELEFPFDEGVAAVAVVAVAAALWGFFWPFRVWGEETPRRRGYHWAMPVDRRAHDLIRTGIGAALLPPIVGLFLLLALPVAALFGHAGLFSGYGGLIWVDLFVAPVIVYLLVSIPVVGSRHPAAWLWGTLGTLAAVFSAVHAFSLVPLMRLLEQLAVGRFGLLSTLGQPVVSEIAAWGSYPAGRWMVACLAWLLVAAAGVVVAASRRHRTI